jgi:hypothetical protein
MVTLVAQPLGAEREQAGTAVATLEPMRNRRLSTAALGLLGSACAAPLPVVRLKPESSDVIWVSGRAVVAQERERIRVAAAFDHQDGRAVAFRVEVENDSPTRFDVDPVDMRFTTCVSESTCAPRLAVADPEQMLVRLDRLRAREEANATNTATAGAALVLLSATADAAAIAKGRTRDAGERTALAAVAADSAVGAHDRRLGRIDSEREVWSTAAFRRTTLLPGQGAAGLVYVPLAAEARVVWLGVSVAGREFWFPFQQAVVAPSPTPASPSNDP